MSCCCSCLGLLKEGFEANLFKLSNMVDLYSSRILFSPERKKKINRLVFTFSIND